jgi:hypothetical protein
VPTLVITAATTRSCRSKPPGKAAELIGNAELKVYDNAPHGLR